MNLPTESARPISHETLTEGAGERKASSCPLDLLEVLRRKMKESAHESMLGLAARYFNLPVLDEDGESRKQSPSEVIVLVVEYFNVWLEEIGYGAAVFNGLPHLYGGSYWQPIEDQECASLLGDLAECIGYGVVGSRIFHFKEKLLKQFHSAQHGKIEGLNKDLILINFMNGTLEITSEKEVFREFRKSDALTYQLPFDYNEESTCPIFDRYITHVLPDASSREILSEFLGWLFLPMLKLEKMLILYGDGQNGKSVFFDLVNALLGERNVSNLGFSSLAKIENRFQLGTSLLNFGSEINDRCDSDLLKKLASGEPVEARRLYKDTFIMRRYARLAFNANELPRNTEQTKGYFRRFLIVPFTVTISDDEKDPDLALKIIASELPGVFNWVMRGLRRLRETRKFSECQAATETLAAYRKESDSVATFLEDECWKASPEDRIGKNQLYSDYRDYCRNSGHYPLSKTNFGKRLLRQHSIHESKSGGFRFWHIARSEADD